MKLYGFYRIVLFCSLIILMGPRDSLSQTDPPNGYQQDFLLMIETLKKEHPGIPEHPLQMMPQDVFEQEWRLTHQQLKNTSDNLDFYFTVTRFLSRLNDGHASLTFSARGHRYIPLMIHWFGDKVYVLEVLEDRFEFMKFKEIKAIAEIPILKLEKMVNEYQTADRGNPYHLRKAMFGNTFFMINESMLRQLNVATGDNITITYIDGTTKKMLDLPFVELTSIPEYSPFLRNEITQSKNKNFYTLHDTLSTIYFQFSSFQKGVDAAVFRCMFEEARENRIRFLVMDLRNASGGMTETCLELFRYLISDPRDCYMYKAWQRKDDRNELIYNGIYPLKPVSENLRFHGRLIVFIGKTTYSAGTFPVVFALDNEFGTLLGQPCGNNSIRYGETNRIQLLHTGFSFRYSTKIWERAKPGVIEQSPFIEPHVTIVPTIEDYIQKKDPVWEYFITHFVQE